MRSFLLFCALAGELDTWLARGEVTVFESKSDGHLRQVTNITDIPAPIEAVWERILDFDHWSTWIPQVAESRIIARTADSVDVAWNLQVLGPPVKFSGRYQIDRAHWTIRGVWLDGALQGSYWDWKLEDRGGTTRLYKTAYINAVTDNWLLRQLDDEAHTMEYGINASSGYLEVKALKRSFGGS